MENKPAATSSVETKPSSTVMHSFTETKSSGSMSMKPIILLIVVAILGVATGYGLSFASATGTGGKMLTLPKISSAEKGKTYGVTDTKEFSDTAEGTLQDGGIDGEGQYHLVRPGGDSQSVYMTSSTVDLSQFIGKKIKVWGATQTAQKAGWLMDVGKVEVL